MQPNGSKRPLGIPTIRDRVVQMATKIVIEPIFEADFVDHSYGFRPKNGLMRGDWSASSLLYLNTSLNTLNRDSPLGRAVQQKPSKSSKVISVSKLSGLQHRYQWQ